MLQHGVYAIALCFKVSDWCTQHCIAAMQWKVVVADESHMMRTHNKPPDAAFTEVAAAIGRRARRLLLLSGTPSLNRPFDLFRQVSARLSLMFRFQRLVKRLLSLASRCDPLCVAGRCICMAG